MRGRLPREATALLDTETIEKMKTVRTLTVGHARKILQFATTHCPPLIGNVTLQEAAICDLSDQDKVPVRIARDIVRSYGKQYSHYSPEISEKN